MMKNRLRAAGLHLALSLLLSFGVAGLVAGVWYPHDYLWLAGGLDLLLIIASVDVVVGPILTLLVFDTRKSPKHLMFDVLVIAVIQVAALAYGVHTTFVARPVALVFEGDRFRLISAVDVLVEELGNSQNEFEKLSWRGPEIIAIRKSNPSEVIANVDLALKGFDTSQRPSFWVAYDARQQHVALDKSLPLKTLMAHYLGSADDMAAAVRSKGLDPDAARFLPVRARANSFATVVLDQNGLPSVFLPFDPYAVKN